MKKREEERIVALRDPKAENLCPHREFCGGCIYQGVPYETQLADKEQQALDLFKTAGIKPAHYEPIVPSPERYHYRNKMEYTFGDLVKDGEMTLGMHRRGSFLSIVTVDQCQLVHEDFNRILSATLEFCKDYTKYNKKQHKGLMRNLVIRCGINTNEILIAIVTTSEEGFDADGYTKMLQALPIDHEIAGILHIINDNVADALKCDELRVLAGRTYYNETILGLQFQVGIFSFFQTNVHAVERLYTDAISCISDYADKKVFDLFCGTGTITQAVAQKAREAVGVEIVPEAVAMAKESAALNGIDNCTFLEGDVFQVLDSLEESPDAIIVDPPRAGISPDALKRIAGYGVEEMVYVSCNYKSLVRDLVVLESYGYKVEHLRFYDNFPFTKHVETVVCLSNKNAKPKDYVEIGVDAADYYNIKSAERDV